MSADPDEIRSHIEETRAELADTVEALSAKADVTGRARAKAAEVSAQARTFANHEAQVAREEISRTQAEKPWLLPSAGGVAVLGLVFWFFARRRKA